MPQASGTIHLLGRVYGELKAEDIPLSADAQGRLAALTHGDDDPLPVVVGVGVGKSTRGWKYTAPYLQKFVDRVNKAGMYGIMGHQRDEDLGHQFPTPVTHWLGAKFDPNAPVLDSEGKPTGERGVAYFRGVVDKTAGDLKRWIRGQMVTQPSIFGRPMLRRTAAGEQEVYDGEPLSIDWAPLGRAGMSTASVLAWGEMDAIGAAPDASNGSGSGSTPGKSGRETVTVTVREAIDALRDNNATVSQVIQQMNWRASDVVPALVASDRRGLAEALPRDVIGQVAAGEIAQAHRPDALVPAFGLKLDQVAPIVDQAAWTALQAEHAAFGEMRAALGLPETATVTDVTAAVKVTQETVNRIGQDGLKAAVDKLIGAQGEMAVAEPLRPLVAEKALSKLKIGADDATVKTAVTEARNDPALKPLIESSLGTTRVVTVQTQQHAPAGEMSQSGGSSSNAPAVGLPVTRRRI